MNKNEEIKRIEEEIDKCILEQLKESTPWKKLDFSDYKDRIPKTYDEFREKILEISNVINKVLDGRKTSEPDAILVGSNGQLLQLYGKATTHDWVVWYVNEFKKGKL